jgi:hypothetical protein
VRLARSATPIVLALALALPAAARAAAGDACVALPDSRDPLCVDAGAADGSPGASLVHGVAACSRDVGDGRGADLAACGKRMRERACAQGGGLIAKVTSVDACRVSGDLDACFVKENLYGTNFTDCIERAGHGLCPDLDASPEMREAASTVGVNATTHACPFSARGTSACLLPANATRPADRCAAPKLPDVNASGGLVSKQRLLAVRADAIARAANAARAIYDGFAAGVLWVKARLAGG